jgi:hypothetical protein
MHPYAKVIEKRAKELGVKVNAAKGQYVFYGDQAVSGYFSDIPEPVLAYRSFGPGAFNLLVHEACHMEQWHRNCKVWRESWVVPGIASEDLIFLWTDKHIEFKPRQLKRMVQLSVDLELDCDRRAARLLRQVNRQYPVDRIDTKDYIRKGNAYIMFWHMVAKTREWYTIGKRPYELPEVYEEFPASFNMDYTKLPRRYERLYKKYCF